MNVLLLTKHFDGKNSSDGNTLFGLSKKFCWNIDVYTIVRCSVIDNLISFMTFWSCFGTSFAACCSPLAPGSRACSAGTRLRVPMVSQLSASGVPTTNADSKCLGFCCLSLALLPPFCISPQSKFYVSSSVPAAHRYFCSFILVTCSWYREFWDQTTTV